MVAQGNFTGERASFQEYTIPSAEYAAKVPAFVSLDVAASLPIGLIAAATGLYSAANLGAELRAP